MSSQRPHAAAVPQNVVEAVSCVVRVTTRTSASPPPVPSVVIFSADNWTLVPVMLLTK